MQSLLGQSYAAFEIILVDDASPDNSIKLAEDILNSQMRISYTIVRNEKNMGIATVRNIGVAHAKGDFIVFVDSDDEVQPTYLETLVTPMVDDEIDISLCQYEVLDTHIPNQTITYKGETYSSLGKVDGNSALQNLLHDRERSFLWRCLFRKQVFDQVQFPDGCNFMEDTITLPCLYANANKVFYNDAVLYVYNFRKNSMTTGHVYAKDYIQVPAMLAKTVQYIKLKTDGKLKEAISRFNYLCCYNIITVKLTKRSLPFSEAKPIYAVFSVYLWKSELFSFLRNKKIRSLAWIFRLKFMPIKVWQKDIDA